MGVGTLPVLKGGTEVSGGGDLGESRAKLQKFLKGGEVAEVGCQHKGRRVVAPLF